MQSFSHIRSEGKKRAKKKKSMTEALQIRSEELGMELIPLAMDCLGKHPDEWWWERSIWEFYG